MRANVVFLILLPAFLLGAAPAAAQENGQLPIQAPETIEEAQEFGLGILRQLPDAVREVWNTQVVPLWNALWDWARNIWDTYAFPWLHGIWEKVLAVFGQELEQRRPAIEQEFEEKKEEFKQEIEERIPEEGKTLWEHIKGFFGENGGN
ncbi:MAG: hypothetical protein Q8P03_00160 [bacterium]|nr:hypothetical protein [bacterium]